jgi:hypothetical protein
MGTVARTDTFFIALMFWVGVPMYLALDALTGVAGIHGDNHFWVTIIGAVVLGIAATWALIRYVGVFNRMSNRMSQWGLGVAQLTLIAYLVSMPIFLIVCTFDRREH